MTLDLLKAIRNRTEKRTEYWHGISTADRYVKTLQDRVGLDTCYKFGSTSAASFSDAMHKAKQTLVYSNEDMALEQKSDTFSGVDLPKNTLIAFKHTLTTPRKDRDGDILRTEGAQPDPKMLLLWQHIHTMPIGKMLSVAHHDAQKLSMISAIVDMNAVSHDAAVMIDNDMGRFSHGFRALEFEELKSEDGDNSFSGFDIKKFEIMEASVVSVPANADAEVEEIVLDFVEGGKLTSGMMKSYGKSIREKRPTSVAVEYKVTVGDSSHEIKAPNAGVFEQIFNRVIGEKNDESTGKAEEVGSDASEETKDVGSFEEGRADETKTGHEEVNEGTEKTADPAAADSEKETKPAASEDTKKADEGSEKSDASLETSEKVTYEQVFKTVMNDWTIEQQEKLLDVLKVLAEARRSGNAKQLFRALAKS